LQKPSAAKNYHTRGSYDPFTSAGRSSIYRSVLRSGPARDSKGYSEISEQREGLGSNAGWRRGIRMCCFAVGICLITESTLLVWALISDIGPPGSGLLYQGKCGKVKTTTICLLLPLNIVATILISTSNYVMQCLVAPDRDEVDTAHAQATWILVGGMRTRSLSFASRTRRLLFMALGLSSIPIHLLLNSAFYNSEQSVDPGVLIVSEDFASDTTWQNCGNDTFTTSLAPRFACSLFKEFNLARLIYMTPEQCMRQYSNGFQANASGVIVITDKSTDRYFSLPGPGPFSANQPASKAPFCIPVPSVLNCTKIPNSDARFGVSISAADGSVDMTSSFYSECQEGNSGDGNVLVPPTPRKDGTYGSSIIYPSSYYSNTNGLYFYEGSILSNLTSIRSVFDAFSYRFFATAAFNNYDMLHPAVDAAKRWDPRSWLCAEKDLRDGISCDPSRMLPLSANWTITPASIPVKACYALPTDEQCSLYYSPLILALTTGLDVIKLCSMMLALRVIRAPFATIGDAIQSFLERPDPYTKNLCLLSSHQAQEWSEASLKEIEAQRIRAQRAWTLKQSQQRPKMFAVTAPIWNSVLWPDAVPRPDCARWIRTSRRWYCVAAKTRWAMFSIL
jgi:hypothetical protein